MSKGTGWSKLNKFEYVGRGETEGTSVYSEAQYIMGNGNMGQPNSMNQPTDKHTRLKILLRWRGGNKVSIYECIY